MKRAANILLMLALLALTCQAQETTPEAKRGAAYVLVLDVSKSTGEQFGVMLDAARAIVSRHREGDTGALITFAASDDVRVMQAFTDDGAALRSALGTLHTREGRSAVVDALYLAAQEAGRAKSPHRSPAVIVITDGEDRASYYKPDTLIKVLRETGTRVYVVGLVNGLGKGARSRAVKLLRRIVDESRGGLFLLESSAELPGIAASIDEAMRKP